MAVHCRCLVFLTLVLLCFASTTATGRRSMRVVYMKEGEERPKDLLIHKIKDKKMMKGSDELVTMDYTPASKKPPIHN